MPWKSPTEEPIHFCLTSGHGVLIGPEPRDIPPFMESDAVARGAVWVNPQNRAYRKRSASETTSGSGSEAAIEPAPEPDSPPE